MSGHTPGVQDKHDEMLYGFFHIDDPRDFFPDKKCCSPEELQAHQAACVLAEQGKWTGKVEEHGPWVNEAGGICIGVRPEGEGWTGMCHAVRSFGIGTYLIHGQREIDQENQAEILMDILIVLNAIHATVKRIEERIR